MGWKPHRRHEKILWPPRYYEVLQRAGSHTTGSRAYSREYIRHHKIHQYTACDAIFGPLFDTPIPHSQVGSPKCIPRAGQPTVYALACAYVRKMMNLVLKSRKFELKRGIMYSKRWILNWKWWMFAGQGSRPTWIFLSETLGLRNTSRLQQPVLFTDLRIQRWKYKKSPAQRVWIPWTFLSD